MTRILFGVIGVLILANVIQFCSSSDVNTKLELQNKQIECMRKCMK